MFTQVEQFISNLIQSKTSPIPKHYMLKSILQSVGSGVFAGYSSHHILLKKHGSSHNNDDVDLSRTKTIGNFEIRIVYIGIIPNIVVN